MDVAAQAAEVAVEGQRERVAGLRDRDRNRDGDERGGDGEQQFAAPAVRPGLRFGVCAGRADPGSMATVRGPLVKKLVQG